MDMIELTENEAESRREIGRLDLPVRFFAYGLVNEELDIIEVTESEFLSMEGRIDYERHSVRENGVAQICLTRINV